MENSNTTLVMTRYLMGRATAGEQKLLLAWLRTDESLRREFIQMKDAYDLGQIGREAGRARTTVQWKKLDEQIRNYGNRNSSRRKRLNLLAGYAAVLAAGVLLSGILTYMFSTRNEPTVSITTIETGIGERARIMLPDSSLVWVNSCSKLSFNEFASGDNRSVKLSGEAYFEVMTDPQKPFTVETSNMTYTVTGTSFNVYSFDDEQTERLALTEGGVRIKYGNQTYDVKPGEVVEYNREQEKFKVKYSDASRHGYWRTGEMTFDRMSFAELAKRLERNFAVNFVFVNDKMKQEMFGGTFDSKDTLETILKVINTSTPMKYRIEGDNVYIY